MRFVVIVLRIDGARYDVMYLAAGQIVDLAFAAAMQLTPDGPDNGQARPASCSS